LDFHIFHVSLEDTEIGFRPHVFHPSMESMDLRIS
jgi:hypothetical protein